MKLSLRKAHKLRKAIEARLAKQRLETTFELSSLDPEHAKDPAKVLEGATASLVKQVEEAELLSEILSTLRASIGRANVEKGIDDLLARSAELDRRIKLWEGIANAERLAEGADQLRARLDRNKRLFESAEARYGTEDTVSASVITESLRAQAADKVVALKRSREEIDDQRLEANASASVEIAEDDTTFLKSVRLV